MEQHTVCVLAHISTVHAISLAVIFDSNGRGVATSILQNAGHLLVQQFILMVDLVLSFFLNTMLATGGLEEFTEDSLIALVLYRIRNTCRKDGLPDVFNGIP